MTVYSSLLFKDKFLIGSWQTIQILAQVKPDFDWNNLETLEILSTGANKREKIDNAFLQHKNQVYFAKYILLTLGIIPKDDDNSSGSDDASNDSIKTVGVLEKEHENENKNEEKQNDNKLDKKLLSTNFSQFKEL